VKRFLTLILLIALLSGCSSSSKDTTSSNDPVNVANSNSKKGSKSRVEFKNADGTRTPVNLPGAKNAAMYDPKTGKQIISKGWVDTDDYRAYEGKHLRALTVNQLVLRLRNASAKETSLIVEEAKSRRVKGVKVLAQVLNDERQAVFPKGREYWWYEKKDADAETIELRVYAAFTLQFITNQYPSGVVMKMFDDRLIFAAKGQYAVVKDDVAKVWKKWWEQSKNDY